MENPRQIPRSPLPAELHLEMHKCLALTDSNEILVNVPSRITGLQNVERRNRRLMAKIKTSLREFWLKLEMQNERNKRDFQWKREIDLVLRFGGALGWWPEKSFERYIEAVPEHFVQRLIMHLAAARSTKNALKSANMHLYASHLKLPSALIELKKTEGHYRHGNRRIFESLDWDFGDGRQIHIRDGEIKPLHSDNDDRFMVTLQVENKIDKEMWEIVLELYQRKEGEFIHTLGFERIKPIQNWQKSYYDEDIIFKQNENDKLESTQSIEMDLRVDAFLRRGAQFTHFRRIKVEMYKYWSIKDYIGFLIVYMANTKHPENVLESITLIYSNDVDSEFLRQMWKHCREGIPEGGLLMHFDGNIQVRIFSVNIEWTKKQSKRKPQKIKAMEFTIANGPTNGAFVFDIVPSYTKMVKNIQEITFKRRKVEKEVKKPNEKEEINSTKIEEKCKKKLRKRIKDDNDEGQSTVTNTKIGLDAKIKKKKKI